MAGSALSDVEVVNVEPRLAAIVRKQVPMAGMPKAERAAVAILDAALAAANVGPRGERFTLWRPPQDGLIDYAPGVFVPHAFEASGDVTLFTLPEGRAAHLCLRGPYEGMGTAWQRLFESCEARGLKRTGLNWQVYVADAGTEPVTDLFTLLE